MVITNKILVQKYQTDCPEAKYSISSNWLKVASCLDIPKRSATTFFSLQHNRTWAIRKKRPDTRMRNLLWMFLANNIWWFLEKASVSISRNVFFYWYELNHNHLLRERCQCWLRQGHVHEQKKPMQEASRARMTGWSAGPPWALHESWLKGLNWAVMLGRFGWPVCMWWWPGHWALQ